MFLFPILSFWVLVSYFLFYFKSPLLVFLDLPYTSCVYSFSLIVCPAMISFTYSLLSSLLCVFKSVFPFVSASLRCYHVSLHPSLLLVFPCFLSLLCIFFNCLYIFWIGLACFELFPHLPNNLRVQLELWLKNNFIKRYVPAASGTMQSFPSMTVVVFQVFCLFFQWCHLL